ncbi:MAG: DUF1643 domain-containing protein [Clostridiales bacterium]|nr:DUF1643 domain-containing protein [Clostridiales bacterium]
MKKRKKFGMSFLMFAIFLLILSVLIIVANILLQENTDWKAILTKLLNDILSVAIVGVIATFFTKIISDNFFKIKQNNDKLLSFGVEKIGEGKSTSEDIINLFGDKKTNTYPSEVKIMFITGNGFFTKFKKDIIECLQNSDCTLKILLMSAKDDNKNYVGRCEALCPQNTTYYDQLIVTTLPILNCIAEQFPNRVEIRYYKDEYRYNFRIAKYRIKDGTFDNMAWLNVQPFNKDAVDLSIGLTGSWNSSDKNLEENMFYQLDKGFDFIWDKYKPETLHDQIKNILIEESIITENDDWQKFNSNHNKLPKNVTVRMNIYNCANSNFYKYIEYTEWNTANDCWVAIGFNPATYDVNEMDKTNSKIFEALQSNCGSYILLNLYPQVSESINTFDELDNVNKKFTPALLKIFNLLESQNIKTVIFWGRTVSYDESFDKILKKMQKKGILFKTANNQGLFYHPARVAIKIKKVDKSDFMSSFKLN